MDAKIGVYLCAGDGVGDMIDLEKLSSDVSSEMKVAKIQIFETFSCDDLEKQIAADIDHEGLNRIVIAGPSGRYFADRFNFGDSVLVERVPIREFAVWTQDPEKDDEEEIQPLATDYVKMGIVKMQNSVPPEPVIEEISKDILVIGGGVAGMSAAVGAADAGYNVVLVEKEAELGGWARKFKAVIPIEAPYRELAESPHSDLIKQVQNSDRIKVHTGSTVEKIAGQPGQFDVSIKNDSVFDVKIGAVVQASGWRPYDPDRLEDKYGYGKLKNVVTNVKMEEMAGAGEIVRPSDGAPPKSVAVIHCAGSRDKEHLAYCSAVCCRAALKQALYIREQLPDCDVFLLYKDIRTPGVYEQFYTRVQEEERIYFMKGEVQEVAGIANDGVTIILDDTLLGEPVKVEADMLVLATGMVPSSYVDQPDGSEEADTGESCDDDEGARSAEKGAKILNLEYRLGTDLPSLKYGFPDSHFICFPYETRRTAIYAAGTVRAPMDISSSMNDGLGAALKAIQAVEAVALGQAVHPRVGDTYIPEFFLQRCTQCKRCTEECPFSAFEEDEKGTPKPNPNRCRRCGICMGACPERIVSFGNYSVNMVSQMIKVIDMPDEFDEKPRVLCFMCENDAVPALDLAAYHRHKIDPIVRIIPVRCLGSVNSVWIADALSNGFDGILLLGCKFGDDYQCHYVKGSELADKRMSNVREKLEQLVLEKERVQMHIVQLSDWDKVTGMINDFAEEIREMDLNPYKGF